MSALRKEQVSVLQPFLLNYVLYNFATDQKSRGNLCKCNVISSV